MPVWHRNTDLRIYAAPSGIKAKGTGRHAFVHTAPAQLSKGSLTREFRAYRTFRTILSAAPSNFVPNRCTKRTKRTKSLAQPRADFLDEIGAAFLEIVILIETRRRRGQKHRVTGLCLGHRALHRA